MSSAPDLLNQFPVATVDPVELSHCYCTVGKLWKLTLYLQVFHNLSCHTSLCLIGDYSDTCQIVTLLFRTFSPDNISSPLHPTEKYLKSSVTGVHAHPAFFVLGTHQIVGQRISICQKPVPVRIRIKSGVLSQNCFHRVDHILDGSICHSSFHLGKRMALERDCPRPTLDRSSSSIQPPQPKLLANVTGTRCGYRFPWCRSLLFSPAEDRNSRGSIS